MFVEKGLIVSCYLEGMKGAEKEFISAVAHNPNVAGLRVEGIDNIRYARQIAPDKFIIGLIKTWNDHYSITPSTNYASEIIHAGADVIATENVDVFLAFSELTTNGISCPYRFMLDLDYEGWKRLFEFAPPEKHKIRLGIREKILIPATTFESDPAKSIRMIEDVRRICPAGLINYEGGILNPRDMDRAYQAGADYVTVGKAFNDPATIINTWMEVSRKRKLNEKPIYGKYKSLGNVDYPFEIQYGSEL